MNIPTHKPTAVRTGTKRTREADHGELRMMLAPAPPMDVYAGAQLKPAAPAESSTRRNAEAPNAMAKRTKLGARKLGPSVSHFTSLATLREVLGAQFLPYGRPLMFLHDPDQDVFVLARSYVMEWAQETHADKVHETFAARSIALDAGYIHPGSMRAVPLGPLSASTFEDRLNLLPALLMLPGGVSSGNESAEDGLRLAQCMYCFDAGLHVQPDATIARTLEYALETACGKAGISLALRHAAAHNDTQQTGYFFNKGGSILEAHATAGNQPR